MKKAATLYIAWIIVSGMGVLGYALSSWQPKMVSRLVLFTLITMVGSLMKVRLPGITGTMSVYFLFLLVSITQFSMPEVMLIGTSAVLLQCYWRTKNRPKLHQVLFNVGSTAIAIHYSFKVYHSVFMQNSEFGLLVQVTATSVIFFALNTGLVSGVVALTEAKAIHKIWYECYFWCFPYYLLGALLAVGFRYATDAFGWRSTLLLFPAVYIVYYSYRLYLGKLEAEKDHVQQVASLHLRTIEALALAIDAKDHTTHEHLRRVQTFATEMGKELGLAKEELEALEAASMLHDIGKLAVPEHIISKPGKLTPEEFEKMKIHPIIGAEILERVEFPYPVAPIVLAHHERWDGSGYPYGLKGEEIPVGARILSVVDCFDALVSDRPYRRAMPVGDAIKHIEQEAKKSYDPEIVALLKKRFKQYETMMTAQALKLDPGSLSHGTKVQNGESPAAGFESYSCKRKGISKEDASDFLQSIAGARQEAHALYELAQSLGSSLKLHDTLSMLAGRLSKLVQYDAVAVYVLSGEMLKPEYAIGVDARFLSALEIPLGQGLSGWVAETRTSILNGNPSVEAGYLNDVRRICTLKSALAVPLVHDDRVVGVLALYSTERDAFSRDEQRVLQSISPKLAMSIANAVQYEQAESSATVDYLTGLPNARALFLRLDAEVNRCTRSNEALAVVVCDLDDFKQVNDRFGHLSGNEVLKAIATEMEAGFRNCDYLARMGGDEFVMLIPNIQAASLFSKLASVEQTVARVCRKVCGEDVISLSSGVAFLGVDGSHADDLLAVADRRMYENKSCAKQRRSLLKLMGEKTWQGKVQYIA
ncbi:MAG: diguanylate cyclase [Bryobacteraceae bacterium]|nr:diguanylate cyclase [Bryobacteraceae bacterium]